MCQVTVLAGGALTEALWLGCLSQALLLVLSGFLQSLSSLGLQLEFLLLSP